MCQLKRIISFLILLIAGISGCKSKLGKQQAIVPKNVIIAADSIGSLKSVVPEQPIINGKLISVAGRKLYYSFNNTNHTMTIRFNGATIILKEQPTGSGIKYANDRYTYTEWQGNSILKKIIWRFLLLIEITTTGKPIQQHLSGNPFSYTIVFSACQI
ncbi:MAG: hypothetical protein COW65_02125 [Cytophagales bacterium CG18_big_fil_WC_8_21_14_2_50_42_9]|nr:MAG: hypothetical protein COW65_02125 [Cytophagales bacterium CG18_big_fil_WC_8_21_14_2_50_42_9]